MPVLMSGKSNLSHHHGSHMHNIWEVISNVQGSGVLLINDEAVPFDENTIVCIPPGIAHEKTSQEGFVDIWLQASSIEGLPSNQVTILTDDTGKNITSLLNVLYSVQYSTNANRKSITQNLWESIQQLVLSRVNRKELDVRVEQVLDSILHHFQDASFTVGSVLSESGYCADHMRRLFCEQVGKTPLEYLMELRLKTAKKLLLSRHVSHYSIAEIGMMTGFQDAAYFSRVFKKHTGKVPCEYADAE